MPNLTRGPLPARVYWTRRLLVAGTAIALVVAITHLFGGGDPEPTAQARPAAAHAKKSTTPRTSGSEGPSATAAEGGEPAKADRGKGKRQKDKKKDKVLPPPLAEPDGTCADEDVAVTPKVHHPVAGGRVTFVMKLRTIESPACTWEVSPDSLTVKVTSGADDIWFSRQCTRSIPREDVVLRNNRNTRVEVTWSGRRSDDTCSRLTDWAMPGYYHVAAAAYAGEPSDVQFKLKRPERPVVTKTVKPKKDDEKAGSKKDRKSDKDRKSQKRD